MAPQVILRKHLAWRATVLKLTINGNGGRDLRANMRLDAVSKYAPQRDLVMFIIVGTKRP
jgi:hypothetical protein